MIVGATPIELQFEGYNDLFVTWSDDNDARLWSWTSGTAQDTVIGLGHKGKLKDLQFCHHSLISVDIVQNMKYKSEH